MSAAVRNLVFKTVLKETVQNNQGREDPYFETVPTKRLVSFSGKPRMKRRRKALPPGLSQKDERTLVKVKRRAYRLDMALGTCCGMKIGWGSVIGIVPAIGDVVDALLALLVIRTACEADIPSSLRLHMFINVVFDFAIGLVPFLGDIADIWYKANTRNAILLEDYLRKRGIENLKKQGITNAPDYSLEDVEEEEASGGVISSPPPAQPQPSYSRGGRGDERRGGDYDVEAQRPAKSKSKKSKSGRSGEGNGGSGRRELGQQTTGTT